MQTTCQDVFNAQRQGAPITILDVRSPSEYGEIHIEGALSMPLETVSEETLEPYRAAAENGTLFVVCRSGARGAKACEKAHAAGLVGAKNIEGGTLAWEQAGFPVVRGKKMVSIERQVRIAAGALVFLGSLLALTVSSAFALIPLFVGGGLVFAGITDTCGMAYCLARMPWNQSSAAQPRSCCSK